MSINPFLIHPPTHCHLPSLDELFSDIDQWKQLGNSDLIDNDNDKSGMLFSDITDDNNLVNDIDEYVFQPPSPNINASPWQNNILASPAAIINKHQIKSIQPISHDLHQLNDIAQCTMAESQYNDGDVDAFWGMMNDRARINNYMNTNQREPPVALYDDVTDTYPYIQQQNQPDVTHRSTAIHNNNQSIQIVITQLNTDIDDQLSIPSHRSNDDLLIPVTPIRASRSTHSDAFTSKLSNNLISSYPHEQSLMWSAAKPVTSSHHIHDSISLVSPFVTTRSKSMFTAGIELHTITPIQSEFVDNHHKDQDNDNENQSITSPDFSPHAKSPQSYELLSPIVMNMPSVKHHIDATPPTKHVRFELPPSHNNMSTESIVSTPSTYTSSYASQQYPRMTPSFTVNNNDVDALYPIDSNTNTGIQPFEIQLGDFSAGNVSVNDATDDHSVNSSFIECDDMSVAHSCTCNGCAVYEQGNSFAQCTANNTLQSLVMLPSHDNTLIYPDTTIDNEQVYTADNKYTYDELHNQRRRGTYPDLPVIHVDQLLRTLVSRSTSCPPEMWHDDNANRKLDFNQQQPDIHRSHSVDPVFIHNTRESISRRASPINLPSIYEDRSFARPMHADYTNNITVPHTPPSRTSRQHSAVSHHSPVLQPIQLLSPMSPTPVRRHSKQMTRQSFINNNNNNQSQHIVKHSTPTLVGRTEPLSTYIPSQPSATELLVDRLRLLEDKIDRLMQVTTAQTPTSTNSSPPALASTPICASCAHSQLHHNTPPIHTPVSVTPTQSSATNDQSHMTWLPAVPSNVPPVTHQSIGAYTAPRQLYSSYLKPPDAAIHRSNISHHYAPQFYLPHNNNDNLYSHSVTVSPLSQSHHLTPTSSLPAHTASIYSVSTTPTTPHSIVSHPIHLPQPNVFNSYQPSHLHHRAFSSISTHSSGSGGAHNRSVEDMQLSAFKQKLFELNEQKYALQHQTIAQKLPQYGALPVTSTYIGSSCSTAGLRRAALDLKLSFISTP